MKISALLVILVTAMHQLDGAYARPPGSEVAQNPAPPGDAKIETNPVTVADPKSEVKRDAAADSKPESKPANVDPKAEAKPVAAADSKPETKPIPQENTNPVVSPSDHKLPESNAPTKAEDAPKPPSKPDSEAKAESKDEKQTKQPEKDQSKDNGDEKEPNAENFIQLIKKKTEGRKKWFQEATQEVDKISDEKVKKEKKEALQNLNSKKKSELATKVNGWLDKHQYMLPKILKIFLLV